MTPQVAAVKTRAQARQVWPLAAEQCNPANRRYSFLFFNILSHDTLLCPALLHINIQKLECRVQVEEAYFKRFQLIVIQGPEKREKLRGTDMTGEHVSMRWRRARGIQPSSAIPWKHQLATAKTYAQARQVLPLAAALHNLTLSFDSSL